MITLMSAANLRPQDWKHRLHVLWAWRKWRHVDTADRDEGATYRAVLDGCAVTLRALCQIIGLKCGFKDESITEGPNRTEEYLPAAQRAQIEFGVLARRIRDASWKSFTLAIEPWLTPRMDTLITRSARVK
jgi:hypothetical protein